MAPKQPVEPKKAKSIRKFDVDAFLTSVGTGRRSAKYKAEDTIFRQGDAANAIYYIEKGRVQITVVSDQGKEGVIGMLGAGEFFGEGCLAGQEFYLASATAVGPSTTASAIDKATMLKVMQEQPALSKMFMSFLLMRNLQIEAELVDQLFNSSEKRLARVLLLLANFGKEGRLEPIPKISQDVLAARVGTTRARINFFMNKFRRLGLIEYNGELRVRSALLNVIVHD